MELNDSHFIRRGFSHWCISFSFTIHTSIATTTMTSTTPSSSSINMAINHTEKDTTEFHESNQDMESIDKKNDNGALVDTVPSEDFFTKETKQDAANELENVNALDYNSALDQIWNHLPFEEDYIVQGNTHEQEEHEQETESMGVQTRPASSKTANAMIQNAIHQTKELLTQKFDAIHSQALQAFHQNDTLRRQVDQLHSLAEQRLEEIHRLKDLESNHRTSLNNLLQALETSKQSCHDYSKHVRTECHLRNEITSLKKQRDTFQETCTIQQQKISNVEEELKMLKGKVTRLMQEKIKVERESRAALSLAKSMDGYNASDVDYYKRKVRYIFVYMSVYIYTRVCVCVCICI